MSEHLSQLQLEGYRQRLLSPSELLALDDHLTGCASCRRLLREIKPIEETLKALRTNLQNIPPTISDHLTLEQLSGYAANRLDEIESELVEDHLEFCEPCLAQFTALRHVAERGNGNGNGGRKEATGRDITVVRPSPPSWRGWVFPEAGWARFSSRLRVTAAILVTTILALSGTLLLRMSKNATSDISVNVPPSSPEVRVTVTVEVTPPQSEPSPGRVLLSLDDGGRQVSLYDNDRLSGLDDVRDEYQQLVIDALKNGQIEIPPGLSELRGKTSGTMGGGGAERFNLEEPVGKVILSDRPTLRWQALDGAESYTVTIVDPRDNSAYAVKSPPLQQTKWQVDRALRRGRIYTWQVTAMRNGARIIAPALEAPQAKFKVLEQNKVDEIAQATTNYANRHLILGLLYARAGLLDDATRELRALAAANPQAEGVKKLVEKLSTERRRGEQRGR